MLVRGCPPSPRRRSGQESAPRYRKWDRSSTSESRETAIPTSRGPPPPIFPSPRQGRARHRLAPTIEFGRANGPNRCSRQGRAHSRIPCCRPMPFSESRAVSASPTRPLVIRSPLPGDHSCAAWAGLRGCPLARGVRWAGAGAQGPGVCRLSVGGSGAGRHGGAPRPPPPRLPGPRPPPPLPPPSLPPARGCLGAS